MLHVEQQRPVRCRWRPTAPSAPESKPAWSLLLAISLAVGLLGGTVHREIVIARVLPTVAGKLTSMEAYRMVIVSFGPAVWLLVTVVVLAALRRWLGLETRARLVLAVPFVLLQLPPFAFTQTDVLPAAEGPALG